VFSRNQPDRIRSAPARSRLERVQKPSMNLRNALCAAEDRGIAGDSVALKSTGHPKLLSAGQAALRTCAAMEWMVYR
jgi:hypothetical protein